MSTNKATGIALAIQNRDDRFSAGDWLYWKCEYEKAREHFQAVLKQPSVSASDSARCYKSMGAVEVELKNYDEALNIYNKQLDILMKCDSPSRNEDIMTCYVSVGKVYWLKLDYAQAIAYHQQALELAQSAMLSPTRISAVHKNLANIYTNTKAFDLALEHFQKALDIDYEHLQKDHLQFAQTYSNMGIMYQSKQNYEEALRYFEKARETWLRTLAPTHLYIEKIENTIRKMKSKLPPKNTASNTPTMIYNAAGNRSHIELPLDIQPVNSMDILARNNIMVIWLDEYIGRDENCRALKMEFRQITNSLKMVDSVDSCRQLLPYVKNRKLFFIIQGKHAKQIVPDIVEIVSPSMKPVVYIFCLRMDHLVEWALEQECIMGGGMFDHEKDLLPRLTKDLNDYVEQKSVEYENYLQSELVSTFLTEFMHLFKCCYQARDAVTPSPQTANDGNQAAAIIAQ